MKLGLKQNQGFPLFPKNLGVPNLESWRLVLTRVRVFLIPKRGFWQKNTVLEQFRKFPFGSAKKHANFSHKSLIPSFGKPFRWTKKHHKTNWLFNIGNPWACTDPLTLLGSQFFLNNLIIYALWFPKLFLQTVYFFPPVFCQNFPNPKVKIAISKPQKLNVPKKTY